MLSDTDYHRELVKMEIQNNQLINELQEREQELIDEKKELEKVKHNILHILISHKTSHKLHKLVVYFFT